MAELSIVGFVLGSLSFIVTVRNAIERLLQDADALKIQTEILVPLLGRLDLLSIYLKTWQTFWHIHDETPRGLFSSYWGECGSGEIRKLLSYVHSQFEKVETEFWSKYGHDLIPRETHLTSSQRSPKSLELFTRSFVRGTSRIQRFKTALFTGSIFYKHLETLETSVKLLQEISEQRFVEHVCVYREAEWKDQVEYTATRNHSTHLADHSSTASEALRDLVEGSKDHNIDFYLDHGASPDQRQKKIFEFARERHIPYNLCVSPQHSASETSVLRIQCQETKKSSGSNITWDRSLQHAFQKLCCSESTSNGLRVYVRIAENTPGFVLSRQHLPRQDLENLRTFMVSTKCDFTQNLHGEFSRPERTRLAYGLAECALLFLRTEWFSELCSCCIYRLESAELKTVFTVRVNRHSHADHIDPGTGESCPQTQWCEQELRSMHIRRLGVLLTEIAIGSPIFEVAFNELKNEVEIDFDVGVSDYGTARAARFKDILRRVRHESSEDFMDAVGYCLKQGTMPRDVTQADFESFYDHVVKP